MSRRRQHRVRRSVAASGGALVARGALVTLGALIAVVVLIANSTTAGATLEAAFGTAAAPDHGPRGTTTTTKSHSATTTIRGDLHSGSRHHLVSHGRLSMPMPALAKDPSVSQSNGRATFHFGIRYAVANIRTGRGVLADRAIIHLSVARAMAGGGPLTIDPEYSKTLVDTQLNRPELQRTYKVAFPANVTKFLDANGLESSDPAKQAFARGLIGIDVEQLRDFRHVNGSYDWQQGGFWVGTDHAVQLTSSSAKSSTVSVQNNTNAGIYDVSNGPQSQPIDATSQYGEAISLSGQAVECVDQGHGTGSNPAGFSLLNGWDIEDNLPPGVLPPGDTVTEPVDADNSANPTSASTAQEVTEGTLGTVYSALGGATPGLYSIGTSFAKLAGVIGVGLDIASGLPVGAILGLINDLLQLKNTCLDYTSVFNLTAAEPYGGQESVSWSTGEFGMSDQYQTLDGSDSRNGSAVTNNIGISPSTGTLTGVPSAPSSFNPYLAQVPVVACGASNSEVQNPCGASQANNFIDVDWSDTSPCPSGFNCAQAPPTSPQVTVPGTDLCGTNNSLCPVNSQPVSGNVVDFQELAQSDQQAPPYAVLFGGQYNQQINALATIGTTAYAGGQNGDIYQFAAPQASVGSGGTTTSVTPAFRSIVQTSDGGAVESMASSGSDLYVGTSKGNVFQLNPAKGAWKLLGQRPTSSAGVPQYMVATQNAVYVGWTQGFIDMINPSNAQYTGQLEPGGAQPSWPGGSSTTITSMTSTPTALIVGTGGTGGYIEQCQLSSCASSWEEIHDNGFGSNVTAMTTSGNTLYIGLADGAFAEESLATETVNVVYDGCPGGCGSQSNPTKNSANPDTIAGMVNVQGNIYFGGCLGVVNPITQLMTGVSTWTSGSVNFAPTYNGCENPTNANNSFYQGFATTPYAMVATTSTPPTGVPQSVIYVAFHIQTGNFVYALENFEPATNATCAYGGC